jgi:hypothetical protein
MVFRWVWGGLPLTFPSPTAIQRPPRPPKAVQNGIRLGVPLGEATRRATEFVSKFILGGGDKTRREEEVRAIVANPGGFTDDPLRGEFARALLNAPPLPRY